MSYLVLVGLEWIGYSRGEIDFLAAPEVMFRSSKSWRYTYTSVWPRRAQTPHHRLPVGLWQLPTSESPPGASPTASGHVRHGA